MSTTLSVKQRRQFVPVDFKVVWEAIEPLYKQLETAEINTIEELQNWMKQRSELEAVLQEDYAWRYIRMTSDTQDAQAVEDFEYFATQIEPQLAPVQHALDLKLNAHPLKSELDPELYFVYLRQLEKSIGIYREENIPLFTQIQLTQQKYQGIVGTMTIEWEGQEYTLSQAARFLKDTNRSIREQVWRRVVARRKQDQETLDLLFDELRKLRHQVALNAGYANFRDYMFDAMGRFDYTPADCENFHGAIERQVVPFLQQIAEKRKNQLGLAHLQPWDLDVDPTGNEPLKPFETGQELIDKTAKCFEKLDPSIGQYIYQMKKEGLFDVESRKGKAPGGYNYPLAETGAPFIFMNAAGNFRDLTTMVHEGGHAIHTFVSAHLPLNEHKNVPSEVAELASMSMELLSMSHWDEFFEDRKDWQRAKKEQLEDVLKTLPWVATIDHFQHWIYTHPEHTAEERRTKWIELFNRYGQQFCEWEGVEDVQDYLWQKQLHLYEVPFYYIEYGMAQLGAIAIWKNFSYNAKDSLANYLEALSLGYTQTIPKIYEKAGIKFDFSEKYVEKLVSFIKNEIQKTDLEL
jgi:oligoendopeptidase F